MIQGKLNVYRMSSTKIKMLITNLVEKNKSIDRLREKENDKYANIRNK